LPFHFISSNLPLLVTPTDLGRKEGRIRKDGRMAKEGREGRKEFKERWNERRRKKGI
jgi:hypothetical protein